MNVLLQYLDNGRTILLDVPDPTPGGSRILVRARNSLISAGTERMLVGFGRAGLIGKVLQARDKIGDIRAKVRANGVVATYRAVREKLAQPMTLGYSLVGEVVSAPPGSGLSAGDRVATNACHGELALVSRHLCARIPDEVPFSDAAFVSLAGIALEGIHLAAVKPGDRVMVVGLGLIGQLASRILLAKGCRVLGTDISDARIKLATDRGVERPTRGSSVSRAALEWTDGMGVDVMLIAASTPSSSLINECAQGCRFRGRIVSVGVVGLHLHRPHFFRSEVSVVVSNSYGDKKRSGHGSAQANFEEVLGLLKDRKLVVDDLISDRYRFSDAPSAYDRLVGNSGSLGILLEYAGVDGGNFSRVLGKVERSGGSVLVGAGNFAIRTLLPALRSLGAEPPELIVSNQGYQAILGAKRFGIPEASTCEEDGLTRAGTRSVFLCTRHDAHARQAMVALQAGKSVWVEKPLALSVEDVDRVGVEAREAGKCLMVGFNRRFAPAAVLLRGALAGRTGVMKFRAVINAGRLDPDHWTLDPKAGGGRIVGEACHWVDLARYLVGSPIEEIRCERHDLDGQDGGCYVLRFAGGSEAVIDYRTDLPPSVPKEQIEVTGTGWSAEIQNWARLRSEGLGGLSWGGRWAKAPRKGHPEALRAFLEATQGRGPVPIPLDEILEVSRVAVWMQAMRAGDVRPVSAGQTVPQGMGGEGVQR